MDESQLSLITQKTPPQHIKERPGPGGKKLKYVEVGYVINLLNDAFGYDWDFQIQDQQIGKRQVWVRGELTVRLKGHTVVKGQYGGADIKYQIADDLKAAASDCLKKCASLFGIAADLYWQDLDS